MARGAEIRERRTMCLAAACLIAAAAGLGATPAAAQDPAPLPRPTDAIQQPVDDGCQRNPAGLLTFTTPEWVYVYSHETFNPDPARARVAEGRVAFADTATGDLPQNHAFYDFNSDLDLNPATQYLIGGDPDTHTGNFGDSPTLHVEWETGTLPPYAWATGDDQMKVWGSWIWDCGHWGQGFQADPNDPAGSIVNDTDYFLPGTNQAAGLRGEGTEFHPMRAVVVTRDHPTDPTVGETQADAFISTAGTSAHAESTCALEHPAIVPIAYPPEWTLCLLDPSKAYQPVNDRNYTFFVPAPPKPDPGASLRVRIEGRPANGAAPPELLQSQSGGVQVTVPFNGFGNPGQAMAFAKRLFVGWDGPVQDHPAKLEVELKRLTINNSLDDPEFGTSLGVPPGEWNLYSDINGKWNLLNDFAPGLGSVFTGQNVDINKTLAVNVPEGDPLRIAVDGRECDLPRIQPCPITSEVAEDNDSPGNAADLYGSVADAIGTHTLTPASGRWQLTYEVRQLAPAFRDPPRSGGQLSGPGCIDTFTPQTRTGKAKVGPKRRALLLKGTASDRDCSGHSGFHTEVAVSRLQAGGLCRQLLRGGRLGPPGNCAMQRFLPAGGGGAWSLRLHGRRPLRVGHYVAHARATDAAGNVELKLDDESSFAFRIPRR